MPRTPTCSRFESVKGAAVLCLIHTAGLTSVARAENQWSSVTEQRVYKLCLATTKNDTTTCTCALARFEMENPETEAKKLLDGDRKVMAKFVKKIMECSE